MRLTGEGTLKIIYNFAKCEIISGFTQSHCYNLLSKNMTFWDSIPKKS